MEKPDKATLQRWTDALDSGSSLRFGGENATVLHSREELTAYLASLGVKSALPAPTEPEPEAALTAPEAE